MNYIKSLYVYQALISQTVLSIGKQTNKQTNKTLLIAINECIY